MDRSARSSYFDSRSKDTEPKPSTSPLDEVLREGVATEVPVEDQWTERTWVQPDREPYEAERREQKLLLRLKAHLEARGHETYRLKIVPPGEAKPLFSDLVDRTTNCLIEAKGTVERGAIRWRSASWRTTAASSRAAPSEPSCYPTARAT